MITDGDPLETKTQVRQLFIKGKQVDLDNKHRRLYEKYSAARSVLSRLIADSSRLQAKSLTS